MTSKSTGQPELRNRQCVCAGSLNPRSTDSWRERRTINPDDPEQSRTGQTFDLDFLDYGPERIGIDVGQVRECFFLDITIVRLVLGDIE
jgi:hypothetical protein